MGFVSVGLGVFFGGGNYRICAVICNGFCFGRGGVITVFVCYM